MIQFDAGKLTIQITIQSKTIAQDAEGNASAAWSDLKTVWAEPLGKTSREFYRLATNNSEITQIFRVRYAAGITPHMRVKFGGTYLGIIGAENEGERNISLLLICKGEI
jgi:SPP1 family predicted phage head-tail adaptor